MTRPEPFKLAGYRIAYLQTGDLPALQDLLESCEDYFELVNGMPASPSEAAHLLSDRPPGKDLEAKLGLGVSLPARKMIAVLDIVKDYPGDGDWWLGLLLIDPGYRGCGLGKSLYTTYQNWACANGARNMLLGVLEANRRAYHFWRSLGFEALEKRPPAQFGAREQIVIVMKRGLVRAMSA
jgi:ribosomal protein S18 acetylase RimI-like enzyme